MNEEIYEGSPAKEDVLIGTDSSYNRYRRPDGSTYIHYPYSLMATVTAYSAKDKKGQPIRTAEGNLITGNTQAEADRNRFRYDMSHWVEANRRKTAHLPQDWRSKYTLSEGKDILTMTPIAGDILDLGNVYTDFNKGNYGMAAAGLGLMFVPNIVEKPLKWVGKPIIKRINNRKAAKAFSEAVDESVIPEYKFNPYSDRPANYVLSVPLTEDVGRTSLKLLERPSKTSLLDKLGISKHTSNNLKKLYNSELELLKDITDLKIKGYSLEEIPDILIKNKSGTSYKQFFKKRIVQDDGSQIFHHDKRGLNFYQSEKIFDPNYSNEHTNMLQQFASQLSDLDPKFLTPDGLQSYYIRDFRRYLHDLGVDVEDLTNEELAKILTLLYKTLASSMKGKAKGVVFWHGSPVNFESFDLKHTGDFTGNMGYGGTGNYFSNNRSIYGVRSTQDFIPNMLPYLINDIESINNFKILLNKKLLPYYVSPKGYSKELYLKVLHDAIENTPTNDNKLYFSTEEVMPSLISITPNEENLQFVLKRNDGIKSLFPHPSLFKRNADGTISLIRNWDDPRVNYKTGGKLIKKQNIKNN